MTEIIVKIIVELLSTLAVATRQIKQGKPSGSAISNGLPGLTRRREVCKEASWGERCRGNTAEARQTYSGRGSDHCSAEPRGCLQPCPAFKAGPRW